MERLWIACAFVVVVAACNPKSLKPGYCHTSADCNGRRCDPKTLMCETDASMGDGGEVGEAGDAKDAEVAPPPRCPQTINCADGGYDGSAGVCEPDAGVCVECLEGSDCASKPTTPICDAQVCRRCKADSECKSGPGVCMIHLDGRCATDDETIYVESKTGCLSAPNPTGGTSAAPFCKLQEALSAIGTRRLLLVRGSGDVGNTLIQNVSGGQISIVGPGTRITAAVGSPGLKVTGSDVYVRGIKILGDSGTDIGIVADSGATLRLDGVTVENMSRGGLRVTGSGYDVVNSLFDGNGGTIDDGGRSIGGAFLGASPSGQPARFAFNTVVANNEKGVICEMTSQLLTASLVANNLGGGTSPDFTNCTLSFSKTTTDGAPNLTTSDPRYRLTAASPCRNAVTSAPANSPDHDIDGTKRPQESLFDCGADEF